MGTLNRRDIMDGLETVLRAVTEVVTVVRGYSNEEQQLDIIQYADSQFPLIYIPEPDETENDALTSKRQMMSLDPGLSVYFIHWGVDPSATYGTLMEKIRNKIGANFTVGCTAVGCWVTSISRVEGTMPLYNFSISLRLLYYLDMLNT